MNYLSTNLKLLRVRALLNQAQLAERIGVKPNTISNYESENSAPDFDTLQKIIKVLDTDANTLLFVDLSKYPDGYPQANLVSEPESGQYAPVSFGDKVLMYVPLVNQPAYAGYLKGYNDVTYLGNLPKMPFLVNREYKGKYMAFEISGDSMDNGTDEAYKDRDIVLGREIARHLWDSSKLHIRKWDFIIAHTGGLTLKRIADHVVQSGTLKLHPLNEHYEDYEVNVKDVYSIFNVVQVDRKK